MGKMAAKLRRARARTFCSDMKALCLALLLALGCSNAIDVPIPPDQADTVDPQLTQDLRLVAAPVLEIDPAIAAETAAALDLWSRATDGAFVPGELHVRLGHITECGPDRTGVGCWYPDTHTLLLSVKCQGSHRVAVIAHEIGHSLGLGHDPEGADTLMDPDASEAFKSHPCIDADTVYGAGYDGPGACS